MEVERTNLAPWFDNLAETFIVSESHMSRCELEGRGDVDVNHSVLKSAAKGRADVYLILCLLIQN